MRVHGLHCSKASASYSARCQPQHIVAGVRFHWSREERRFQCERFVGRAWFILAASARAWRCAPQTESNGGFGFQTKMKDRFLNQRRWTCWYSFLWKKKHASPVSDRQFSFTLLFVFVLKSLSSLLFTSMDWIVTQWRLSLIFLYYYYLIPQCLLNILYFISQYSMWCVLCHASSYSFLLINVM